MYSITTAFSRFVAFIPNLIAGLFVLAIGALIGWLAERVLRPVLHRVGFDRLLARHRLIDSPETASGSRGLGLAVFWAIFVAALMQACRAWELASVADGLERILGYLPHVIAAAVVLMASLMFGNWVRDRMRSARETVTPGAVRAGIVALGVFMALRELTIAPQIVTIGFTLVLGTIAVATALSFGLGTRGVAGRMAEHWYLEKRGEGEARAEEPEEPIARPPTH
jgi:hypothetical protein